VAENADPDETDIAAAVVVCAVGVSFAGAVVGAAAADVAPALGVNNAATGTVSVITALEAT